MARGITSSPYGQLPDGTPVALYRLTNRSGAWCEISTYGAIITALELPDRTGMLGDVVLGFERLDDYLAHNPYFGAVIGRVSNRVAKGTFLLNGRRYTLATNNGANALHGGRRGFDKVIWQAEPRLDPEGPALGLRYTSADGEEGYPGELQVQVTYAFTDANELRISYEAVTDRDTPLNLTNHSYWNLAGQGTILAHELRLCASRYTPVDEALIPTGVIAPVAGGPMDFTSPKEIGRDFAHLGNQPVGYDHNFVIDGGGRALVLAARVRDPATGRILEVLTDQPGVQFYTGNFLDGSLVGKRGQRYGPYAGFCLETQHFPDAVNQPHFPSTILRPGETFRSTTVHRFSVAPS